MNRSALLTSRPFRWSRGLLLGALLSMGAFGVASAQAGTSIVAPVGDPNPYQQWIQEAKAPTPEAVVRIERSTDCSASINVLGCAYFDNEKATGTLKLSPSLSGEHLRKVFFHELAHVFDFEYVYDTDRPAIASALGFPAGTPWRNPTQGLPSPQEYFAEAAAVCYFGSRPADQSYGFSFGPESTQVQSTCQFMSAAVTRPAKVPSNFTITVPAKRKFTGTMLFVSGTLSAELKLGARTWRSNSQCTDRLGDRRRFAFVNTCTQRVMVANRGDFALRITYRGIPRSVPSDGRYGAISQLRARVRNRSGRP